MIVAPHAGAWIETQIIPVLFSNVSSSRPTRARGLKPDDYEGTIIIATVAPHAGAWIETLQKRTTRITQGFVAPHAGAWIETRLERIVKTSLCRVAPHAGAWIETCIRLYIFCVMGVAPHAGAWIETMKILYYRF